MKKYERPNLTIVEANVVLLSMSGPGATDIGAPSFDAKESVWDEEESNNTLFNIKEEQNYEDWI